MGIRNCAEESGKMYYFNIGDRIQLIGDRIQLINRAEAAGQLGTIVGCIKNPDGYPIGYWVMLELDIGWKGDGPSGEWLEKEENLVYRTKGQHDGN